jgi:sigma-E factor negative regulatory protein RseC
MKEIGRVIENRNKISLVEVGGAYCESCASKEKCFFHRERNKIVEAENILDAKPGDLVILDISPKKYIFSTSIIYLFPIFSLFIGAIIGEYFLKVFYFKGENISNIIFAFLFLVISILIIKFLNKILFFRPKIEEITDEEKLRKFNVFNS